MRAGQIADRAGVTFAQFVMLTPYPGTVDFDAWEEKLGTDATRIAGVPITRHRLTFVLISKLYRQMYANTGIATASARVNRANRWARLIARPCRHFFTARPLPGLSVPTPNA